MNRRAENVDGFSETLAKVRKVVHKIFPRELSPTRLLEKYAADTKRRGQAKVAAAAAESQAHKDASDELLRRQLATINAAMPGVIAPEALNAPASQLPMAVRASSAGPARTNYVPWIVGGALTIGALMLLGGKRR